DTGLAERHQQLSFGAELEHLVALAILAIGVGDPDVVVVVDVKPVRHHEQAGAEGPQLLAGRIQLHDRRDARADAMGAAAALEHPDVAVAIEVDAAGVAPLPAVGKLAPAFLEAIRRLLGQDRNRRDRRKHGGEQPIRNAHDGSLCWANDISSYVQRRSLSWIRPDATCWRPESPQPRRPP